MIFDTHAHYDDEQFDEDREAVLCAVQQKGVGAVVNICSDIASWNKVRSLTETYPFIYGAAGVHPDHVGDLNEDRFAQLRELLNRDKMVAVGEIGLDYYWNNESHELQKEWFARQLGLAGELSLPVVIHSREAAADTLDMMKKYGQGLGGVIHCFSYTVEMAREYVDMGFYIGIGGVLTFKNARKLREVVEEIPVEALVLETDCPYLCPEPDRGKRNSSFHLTHVAEKIAELKGLTYDEVLKQTECNARACFKI